MPVKSPCIEVCKFDSNTGLCVGCFRTVNEVREWNKMNDYRRHQIINDRARREKKLAAK